MCGSRVSQEPLCATCTSNYPSRMARFQTACAFLFVSIFIVLPLYELADVGEHWHHDGNYVAVMFTVLFFIGLTLILRTGAAIASRNAVAVQACQSGHLGNVARTVAASIRTATDASLASARTHREARHVQCPSTLASILDSTECSRLLILRDFRI
jgi:hypothetical protein